MKKYWLLLALCASAFPQDEIKPGIINNVRWVTPDYNWSQSIASTLTAGVPSSPTLTPCPVGVDTSNFSQAAYKIAINSGAEYVAVTGGTCTSGAASGTVTFTPANNYGSPYTLGSASTGIQEAVIDACNSPINAPPQTGGQCEIDLQPSTKAGITNVNYTIGATVFLWTRNGAAIHLNGHDASIRCNTRDRCIFVGQMNSSTIGVTLNHMTFFPGINVDGAQVADITWSAGTMTVHTAAAHSYVVGDCVSVRYSVANDNRKGLFKVATVADNTHFTSTANCLNTANANLTIANSSGFGWTGLEAAALEDDANQSAYDHIYISDQTSTRFGFHLVVDNDQHTVINDFILQHGGPRCTANFCGEAIYGPANQGAGIIEIHHSDLSSQCGGNGIFQDSGNGLYMEDTIVQAFQQTGINNGNVPFQGATLSNAYQEAGPTCVNPYYPGGTQQGASTGVFLQRNSVIHGQTPIQGNMPTFATGGASGSTISYFVQPISSIKGRGPYLPVGIALPSSGAVTINLAWPSVNLNCGAAGSCGTITYDLIATTGAAYTPLTGTGNWLVSAATACTPTNAGFCTFADTQAARGAYTIQTQTWGPATASGGFGLWWWPGGLVSDGATVLLDQLPNGSGIISTWGSLNANLIGHQCLASNAVNQVTMVAPAGSWCVTGDPLSGQGFRAQLVNILDSGNNGAPATSKGIINVQSEQNYPNYTLTLKDSNRQKTMATINKRPTADANDSGLGFDANNQLFSAAATAQSRYIGVVPDNSAWLERLTATLESYKVPVTVLPPNATDIPLISQCNSGAGASQSCFRVKDAGGNTIMDVLANGSVNLGSGTTQTIMSNTSSNSDLNGVLTLSGGAQTYTFTGSYITAPICVATDTTAANTVKVTTSTTTLTINGTGTDVIYYMCTGRT